MLNLWRFGHFLFVVVGATVWLLNANPWILRWNIERFWIWAITKALPRISSSEQILWVCHGLPDHMREYIKIDMGKSFKAGLEG